MQQKYAKWKATEIHKCLQAGETPKPGPAGSEFEGDFGAISSGVSRISMPSGGEELGAGGSNPPAAGGFSYNQPNPGVTPVPAPRKVSESVYLSQKLPKGKLTSVL